MGLETQLRVHACMCVCVCARLPLCLWLCLTLLQQLEQTDPPALLPSWRIYDPQLHLRSSGHLLPAELVTPAATDEGTIYQAFTGLLTVASK